MFTRITVAIAALLLSTASAGAAPYDADAEQTGLRIMDLQYLEGTNSSRLVIRANLPFSYEAYTEGRSTLVIETEKADTSNIAPGITIGSRSVESIKVSDKLKEASDEVTAFTIRYRPDQSYKIVPRGRRLFIEFTEKKAGAAAERKVKEESITEPKQVKLVSKPVVKAKHPETRETAKVKQAPRDEEDQNKTKKALNYRLDPIVHYSFKALKLRKNGGDSAIVITLDRPVERRLYRIVPVGKPPRFVLDLHGATNRLYPRNTGFIRGTEFSRLIISAPYVQLSSPLSRTR